MIDLSKLTREELERKLLHMVDFSRYQIALEWNERMDPSLKIIRTKEAEDENEERIFQFMIAIWPAWDIVEMIHPEYDVMKEWVKKNVEAKLVKACVCEGCKK
jgi:hypothetical protein